ncbi:hypothetical protein AB0C02_28700 [Micromonospora sp. NPDC048999]|uniref:hypothetical protein n=1 Tax=Micromonospora sp. NPDC048999 TaxID=3155391 RepID=UPI0034046D37
MWQLAVAGILAPFLLAAGSWWIKEVLTARRRLIMGGAASAVLLVLVIGLTVWGLRPSGDSTSHSSGTSPSVSASPSAPPATADEEWPTSVDQCRRLKPAGALTPVSGKTPLRHELYTWVEGCIIKLGSSSPDWDVYLQSDWSDGALWSSGESVSTNANIGEVKRGGMTVDSCGEAWLNRDKDVSVMHDGLKFCIFPGPKVMVVVRHITALRT